MPSLEDVDEIERIIDELSGKQRNILMTIAANGSSANTYDITSVTSLTNQDVGYHAKRNLIPGNLLEQAGYEDTEKGGEPANKYRLTELGEEVVFEIRREHPTPRKDEIDADRIESIEQDIDRLFRLLGEADERSSTNREALIELRDRVDSVRENFEESKPR